MENLNSRRSQILASFCMGFVFICIGIPMWWKTTEVYRADLPYSEIQKLAENPKIWTRISMKLVSTSKDLTKIGSTALANAISDIHLPFIDIKFQLLTSTLTEHELEVLWHEISTGKIAPKTDVLLILTYSKELKIPKVFVSKRKVIFVELPTGSSEQDAAMLGKDIVGIIKESIINAQATNDVVSKAYGARLDFAKETEFHMRKTVRPDKGYDLLFSLLCPEPDKLQASWDIHTATSLYLKPMLIKLGSFADFHTGSQVLYYSGLSVKPKRDKTGNTTRFYLAHQQLPHVVNPIESRLGAQISPNPTLNFVIYMAEEKYNPLHIQRQDGSISTTNTFLVPRWGAIMIKNVEKINDTRYPHHIKLESLEFMEIFIAQLRSLLGIETPEDFVGIKLKFEEPDSTGITEFELDYLFRARIAENIATSVHTLHSLAQLLEKIQNIVINDKIAEHVYTAVQEIHYAKLAFENSELQKALDHSNSAFTASETAFFDPTLLELLYFPEDQKFAIYIPLFLPISLPLLGSLWNAIKLRKGKRQEAAKKKSE